MEGLNNLLNELAKMLGVGTDALKGTLDSIGANYKEVYSILVREYAIKEVINSLFKASSIGLIVFCAVAFILSLDKPKFKISRILKVCIISCMIIMVLTLFGPIFYPNINLIMDLLDK